MCRLPARCAAAPTPWQQMAAGSLSHFLQPVSAAPLNTPTSYSPPARTQTAAQGSRSCESPPCATIRRSRGKTQARTLFNRTPLDSTASADASVADATIQWDIRPAVQPHFPQLALPQVALAQCHPTTAPHLMTPARLSEPSSTKLMTPCTTMPLTQPIAAAAISVGRARG